MSSDKVELKTERLLLRPVRLEDVDAIYAYCKDPEYARFATLRHPRPYTRRSAEEFVARELLAPWTTQPSFSVVLDSVVVGGTTLNIDETHETAEIGYDFARAHWGKGLAPEAAQTVIDWAFREYGLAKIYATADVRNRRSTRVMEKVGMTREGVLRSQRKGIEERVDEAYYGVLREEWEKR